MADTQARLKYNQFSHVENNGTSDSLCACGHDTLMAQEKKRQNGKRHTVPAGKLKEIEIIEIV